MNIIKKQLPITEFYSEKTIKTQIVLHHTVSSNADSPINWWKQDGQHVSVSYVIAKNGDIYECFDSDFWSYHIGKGSTTLNNKSSIGIEIVNEGILQNAGDHFTWLDGKGKYTGNVFDNQINWRGGRFFASYTPEQMIATSQLVKHLTLKHNIPINILKDLNFDKQYFNHKGVVSHRNLRADKTDLSPAFDFQSFENLLNS
jgi:N-acetyl-anhydromuramyl-L-alanine amidase AmpD